MYSGYVRPTVTIEQKFVTANPVLLNPQLPACIIGPCYQVLVKESTATEYDWASGNSGLAYPSLLVGATVDNGSAPFKPEVYIKNILSTGAIREYLIDDADIILNAASFEIAANLIKNLMLWSAGYKGTIDSGATKFTDLNRRYFDYDIKGGDQICFDPGNPIPTWFDISAVSGYYLFTTGCPNQSYSTDFKDLKAFSYVEIGTTYTDETEEANDDTVNDMTLPDAITDAYYIGDPKYKFGKISFTISTPSTGGTIKWYYWNGTAWTELTALDDNLVDGTTGFTSAGDVTFNAPSDWAKCEVGNDNSDKINGYWIKAEADTAPTSGGTGDTAVLGTLSSVDDTQYAIRRNLGGTNSDILITYRALRTDVYAQGVQRIESVDDIETKLGKITYVNPLAMGAYFALNNTISAIYVMGVNDTIDVANQTMWSNAFDKVGDDDNTYGLVPLTQNTTINGLIKTHVQQYSDKDVGHECIAFTNILMPEYGQKLDPPGSKKGAFDPLDSKFVIKEDIIGDIDPGNSVLDDSSGGDNDYHLIITKSFANTVSEITIFTGPEMDNLFLLDGIEYSGAYESAGKTLTIEKVDLTSALEATGGDWIYDPDDQKIYLIASVAYTDGDTIITLEALAGSDYAAPASGIDPWNVKFFNWTVEWVDNAYDKGEVCEQVAIYAESFDERRITLIWPDQFYYDDVIVGNDSILEGFYIGCCVAGMTSAYHPSQGFTNLTFTGPKILIHSNTYFSSSRPGCQLDHMADGGVYIIIQDSPLSLPYCRHQLTTDRDSIAEQEHQTTRCLDYSAKLYRAGISSDIGINNITPAYLSLLIGTLNKLSQNLLDEGVLTKAEPQIPSIIGAHVQCIIKTDVPTPLNGLDLVLYVG